MDFSINLTTLISVLGGIFGGGGLLFVFGYIFIFLGKWGEKEKVLDKNVDTCNQIKDELSSIKAILDLVSNKVGAGTSQTKSPITLNEKGKEIAKNTNIRNIIKNNFNLYKDKLESYKDNTYDLNECSMQISKKFYENLDDSIKDAIKKEMFNNGLPLSQYYPVIAIYLRDKVLKDNDIKIDNLKNIYDEEY